MNYEPQHLMIGVIVAVCLLPFIWLIASYNRFVRLKQHLRESWSDIDVELKRRYELIPNLVETVRGYAAHEKQILENVIKLRNAAKSEHGSPAQHSSAETNLQLGLKKVFAVSEGYPDLKADQNFLALQKELALTEDRIAAARRLFNGNVREQNQLCESFPTNMIASVCGFKAAGYFKLSNESERVVPRVGDSLK